MNKVVESANLKDENVSAAAKVNNLRKKTNSTNQQKNFQAIRENIENKIVAFLEKNKDIESEFRRLVSVNKLMEAGAGNALSRRLRNPKMNQFLYCNRNSKNQIIDLLKMLVCLNSAYGFLYDITKQGGHVLFVGTQNQYLRTHIQEVAERTKSFYVNQRWLGGTLTNFKTINNTINNLNKKMALVASENINNYSKKEQLLINKDIARMNKFVGGIRTMRSLPQVLVVLDPVSEHNAVAEARKLNIPIVAIANVNADPNLINFIIPANTHSYKTIWLLTSILGDAIAEALGEQTVVVGKTDEEIVLPVFAPKNQQRQMVDFKANNFEQPKEPVANDKE